MSMAAMQARTSRGRSIKKEAWVGCLLESSLLKRRDAAALEEGVHLSHRYFAGWPLGCSVMIPKPAGQVLLRACPIQQRRRICWRSWALIFCLGDEKPSSEWNLFPC